MNLFGQKAQIVSGYDSAQSEQIEEKLSDIEHNALVADIANMRGWALQVVLNLIDALSDGLEEDETPSSIMYELIDDVLGEDDNEGQDLLESLFAANLAEAFSKLGVDDETINDIMSDDSELADAAIEAAIEIATANLPDAGEPLDEFYNEFVYGFEVGADALKDEYDEVVQFPTKPKYKNKKVVRDKKVKTIKVRTFPKPNEALLDPDVKKALQEGRKKAHSGDADKKRAASLAVGKKEGIYKKANKEKFDCIEDNSEDGYIYEFDMATVGHTSTKSMGGRSFKYKGVKKVRNGKVAIVNERQGEGHVRLSAAQKAAGRKARAKSHTANAEMKRKRSMNKRKSMGL